MRQQMLNQGLAWTTHLDQRCELRLTLALDSSELALVDPIGRQLARLIDTDDALEQLALRGREIDGSRSRRLGRSRVASVGGRCERPRACLGAVRPSALQSTTYDAR